jgi:hypothetical protein
MIESGFSLECDNCAGGNVELFITDAANILGVLYDISPNGQKTEVKNITMAPGTKFYQVEYREDEFNFKEPFTQEPNKVTIYKTEYEIDLGCRSKAQRDFLLQLVGGCKRFAIIHKERASGNYWINGQDYHADKGMGLNLLSGDSDTGKVISDTNKTVLKFGSVKGLLSPAFPLESGFTPPL